MYNTQNRRIWGIVFLSLLFISILSNGIIQTSNIENINDQLDISINSENYAEASDVLITDLNLYNTGQIKPIPIVFNKNTLYNVSIENTGDASIFAYLVQNISTYSATTMQTSSVYSDELIESVGIPWWGSYNAWDTSSYSSRVSIGANVASRTQKSMIFYLDNSFTTNTISLTLLLKLQSTSNPYNNTVKIDWNAISISSPKALFNYTNGIDNNTFECAPTSFNIVQFTSKDGIDRTVSVLNETVSVNSSVMVFQWRTDLSGNTVVNRRSQSGLTNALYVPEFENFRLNEQIFFGLILNILPTYSHITWNFSAVDNSLNYSAMSYYTPEQIEMPLNYFNTYWRTFDVPTNALFNLSLIGAPFSSQTYWDVSVDIYSIGSANGLLFNVNNYGANLSESATIFTMTHTTEYTNYDMDYLKSAFKQQTYYWVENGIVSPSVLNNNKATQRIGIKISASHTIYAMQNFNCTIQITDQSISNMISGESLKIGAANGTAFNDFAPFQIRKFNFNNFAQYKWSVHSENASSMQTTTQLRCNDIDTDKYVSNMNNSLISIAIDTTSYMGAISLEFDFAGYISNQDALHVKIRNSTKTSTDYAAFTSIATSTFAHYTYDISAYNDTNVQIIFNMTSNANGENEGAILDNIKVLVGSNVVFFDDLEGEFNKWTSYDHSVAGDLWRTDRFTASTNIPKISIIYPNTEYSFNGYEADPFEYTNFTYNVYNYNPFVQASNTGYIIVSASSALVQNFTVSIVPTQLSSIAITNATYIQAPYTNTNLVSQNGNLWEETVYMDDTYNYYRLDLGLGLYNLMFKIQNSPLIYYSTSIYNVQGQVWSSNVANFYGTIFINQTYQINSTVNQSVYFDFGDIGFGREIQIIVWEMKISAPLNSTSTDENKNETPNDDVPPDNTLVYVLVGLFSASAIINLILGQRVKKIKKEVRSPKDK